MPAALSLLPAACAGSSCDTPHSTPAAPAVVVELMVPDHFVQQLMGAGYDTVRVVVGSQPAGTVLLDQEWPLQVHMAADAAAVSVLQGQLSPMLGQQQRSAAPAAVGMQLPLHFYVSPIDSTRSPLQVLPIMLLGGTKKQTGSTNQAWAGSATSAGSTWSGTGSDGAASGSTVADSSTEADGRGGTMQAAKHQPGVLAQLPLLLLPEAAQSELHAFAEKAAGSYGYEVAYSLLLPMLRDLGHAILWARGMNSASSSQSPRQLQQAVLDALAACFDRLQLSSCNALLQQLQREIDAVSAGDVADTADAASSISSSSGQQDSFAGVAGSCDAASLSVVAAELGKAGYAAAVDVVQAISDQGAPCSKQSASAIEERGVWSFKHVTGLRKRLVQHEHHTIDAMAGRVDSGSSSSSGTSSRGSSFTGHVQHSLAKPNKLTGPGLIGSGSSISSHAQSSTYAIGTLGMDAHVTASHAAQLGWRTLLFGFPDRAVEQAYKQAQLQTLDMRIMLFYLVGFLLALRKFAALVLAQASQQELIVSFMRAVFLVVNALPHALLWYVNSAGQRRQVLGVSGQARGAYFMSCILMQVSLLNCMVWLGEPWRSAILQCMARYQESTLLNLAFRHVVLPVLMRMSVASTLLHVVLMNNTVAVDARFEQPRLVTWLGPWGSLFVMGGVNVIVAAALEHGMRKGFLRHMRAAQ